MSDEDQTVDTDSTPQASQSDAVQELRMVVYALGVLLLLISLSFNIFLGKQNRVIQMQVDATRDQANRIDTPLFQQNTGAMRNLLSEIAQQTPAHPEAQQILARYNIRVETQQPPASATPKPK